MKALRSILPVICLLWWAGGVSAGVDTVYIQGAGEACGWFEGPTDSLCHECVNETSLNLTDSIYAAFTGVLSWAAFDVDTATSDYDTIDSVIFHVAAFHESTDDSIIIHYDTNGTNVADWDIMGISVARNKWVSTIALTGLAKRNIKDIELGVEAFHTTLGFEFVVHGKRMLIFFPSDAATPSRRRQLLLRQYGSIREILKHFAGVADEIPD